MAPDSPAASALRACASPDDFSAVRTFLCRYPAPAVVGDSYEMRRGKAILLPRNCPIGPHTFAGSYADHLVADPRHAITRAADHVAEDELVEQAYSAAAAAEEDDPGSPCSAADWRLVA